jgi:hypothetical protein
MSRRSFRARTRSCFTSGDALTAWNTSRLSGCSGAGSSDQPPFVAALMRSVQRDLYRRPRRKAKVLPRAAAAPANDLVVADPQVDFSRHALTAGYLPA